MFTMLIKNGTCGHHDYDRIDKVIAKIPSDIIPRVNDVIDFDNDKYIVREVELVFITGHDKSYVNVYVVNY